MSAGFSRNDVQGNILRGIAAALCATSSSRSPTAATRKLFGVSVAGGNADFPGITSEAPWREKPTVCFNIGLTFEGLRAPGTPGESLAPFPIEFVEGMTGRVLKLGDFRSSAPANWPAPFDKPARVQMIASMYADDEKHLEGVESQVARAFTVLGVRKGRNLAGGKVFFGFADNISQPRLAELRDPDTEKVDEPIDPLGTALLGYRTRIEKLRSRMPTPEVLGHNGSFNAFRILKRDAAGFNAS